MSLQVPLCQLARSAKRSRLNQLQSSSQVCYQLSLLRIGGSRTFHASASQSITPQFRGKTFDDPTPSSSDASNLSNTPTDFRKGSQQNPAIAAARRARAAVKAKQEAAERALKPGSLASNSLFAEEEPDADTEAGKDGVAKPRKSDPMSLEERIPQNMAFVLNPRPNARSRWQRRMVIHQIRRSGRLSKQVKIARTERSHLCRSHFFKTSMKKLAPLARQIAGKSIDEAILQMRFSHKKVAQDVRKHLIHARDEAIVAKGMGLPVPTEATESSLEPMSPESLSTATESTVTATAPAVSSDPSTLPPAPSRTPTLSLKSSHTPAPTDIYIAQAWTNRGKYGQTPDPRAFGRMYIMRNPHTGISVLLKEEKTRTRERAEKEAKTIRKRLGKNMWTQLPDRKIVRQSQYVLW